MVPLISCKNKVQCIPVRVSAKRKIHCISLPDAVFLPQFYLVIIDHISQNQSPEFSRRLEKNYIEKYCDFFEMAFAKIRDFLRSLKTLSKAPK